MDDNDETRARIRAARAYADLSLTDLADRVEFGRMTLIRIQRGDRPAKRMELRAIAEACGLPLEFFTVRWEELRGTAPAPAPPGELGRRLEARSTSREDPQQSDSPVVGGGPRGSDR